MTKTQKKPLGLGSLSLVIFLLTVLFIGFSFGALAYLQKEGLVKILMSTLTTVIPLPLPYGIITIFLLGFAIYIGNNNKEHAYAKTGKVLSVILLVFYSLFFLYSILSRFKIFG